MKKKIIKCLKWTCAILLLLGPLGMYAQTFGYKISSSHSRWSEFGSAMAGIYGPVIAAFTLYILYVQNKAQMNMHSHQLTQEILSKAQGRIQHHLGMLTGTFSDGATSTSIAHYHETLEKRVLVLFGNLTTEALSDPDLKEKAEELGRTYPKIIENWSGVYAHFGAIARIVDSRYEGDRLSMEFTIFSTLSRPLCIALDNFHYAATQGEMRIPYYFSPILRQPLTA